MMHKNTVKDGHYMRSSKHLLFFRLCLAHLVKCGR